MAFKAQVGRTVSDINVTPMVDVMLVLLIIFMVITPMLQKGVSVDLAIAHKPRSMSDADKEDAVLVTRTRDGNIYLGQDPVSIEDLHARIKDRIVMKLDRTVFVKSDASAKYGTVVEAINNIRAAGVEQLGLITEKVEGRPGAAPTMTP
jgi:biopolymer transport protein ExbD/biopolymer transport protein TolR